jgi:hypothetical protein
MIAGITIVGIMAAAMVMGIISIKTVVIGNTLVDCK